MDEAHGVPEEVAFILDLAGGKGRKCRIPGQPKEGIAVVGVGACRLEVALDIFFEIEVAEVGLRWMLLLAPDCALAHYLLATTLRYRNRPDLARLHAAEAARLGAIGQDRNDPRGAREL